MTEGDVSGDVDANDNHRHREEGSNDFRPIRARQGDAATKRADSRQTGVAVLARLR
jgi:hypothetical protein